MEITKWHPFRELDSLFDRYAKSLSWPQLASQEMMTAGDWTPRVDISETDKEFIIKAEIPEVGKDDVKVTVDNGVLTIRGERKKEKEEKDKKFHRIERFYGSFARSFTLPDNVDENNIEAKFADGVLNLQLPKIKEKKPKGVDVKIK